MESHSECLNGLSLDLEREIETQRELSVRVKANLSLPAPQTRQIQKLLTANQRCSMEFHRVVKKLQHLQRDYDVPSRELRDCQLRQKMDLRIEEILKDFSESDFHRMKTEFQQVGIESFRQVASGRVRREPVSGLQAATVVKPWTGLARYLARPHASHLGAVAIIGADLSTLRFKNVVCVIVPKVTSPSGQIRKNQHCLRSLRHLHALVNPATQDAKNLHVTSKATQLTTELHHRAKDASYITFQSKITTIQELETALHEARESAMHKEDKIIEMQRELEMSNDVIAKL
ncbi:hypothetical protein HPG69_001272 [Diceros bicornis minor]|uniref:Uncharacterized protein n=1 Tax=Diceros bicornis minor TaxID=77932 RepID=A0A7J7FF00_DICBM|nr:hypothetical protein HPG69_001272 [Diceros bicornis minor]